MNDLKEYTLLITGSATGNGFGIAKYCCKYFKKIILVDKDNANLLLAKDFLLTKVKGSISEIIIFQSDLSKIESRKLLISDLEKSNKEIHCLVNNAGISIPKSDDMSLDKLLSIWDKTIEVNLKAPYHLISGIQKIIPDKIGTIINITSLNSKLAFPDNPSYMASKGGLRQLSMSFALDLAKRGIRVNSIAPGYFKTNMTSNSWNDKKARNERNIKTMLGRWGNPIDLGGTVCYLASNISSYLTGQEIFLDGGWTSKGL